MDGKKVFICMKCGNTISKKQFDKMGWSACGRCRWSFICVKEVSEPKKKKKKIIVL